MVVHRRRSGLDDKHIFSTDGLQDLDVDLPVGEALDLDGVARLHAELFVDLVAQAVVGGSAEEHNVLVGKLRHPVLTSCSLLLLNLSTCYC